MIERMLANTQYQVLKKIFSGGPHFGEVNFYEGKSKARVVLGEEFIRDIQGKVIIDFGCGEGTDRWASIGRRTTNSLPFPRPAL